MTLITPDAYHSVVVVGAGLSGLYAARLLKEHYPDVLLVEAQGHIGGRVRQVHGLTGWPIEAGPEFIHGNKSKFTELVAGWGFNFVEKEWPDWWYFGKERRLVSDDDVEDEVNMVHDLFAAVGEEPSPTPDVSAEQWLREKGATEKQLAVAEACYANDFACSIRQLGLREMIKENKRWDSGETYLVMDQSLSAVVQRLAAGLAIRTSFPITHVSYDAGGAVLRGPAGALAARKVIITVPLKVLQRGQITFAPPLPPQKAGALRRLRMGNVVKILVAFSRAFWPHDMYDVVCTDSFVPELWMTQHKVVDVSNMHLQAVTGFIAGERADEVARMEPHAAVARFLDQLDEMFGTTTEARPASAAYVKAHVFDWSKETWVGAAYSYPSLGAEEGDREALAAPVAGTLFFAGEATHPAVNPCMQAALETAERAAAEVRGAMHMAAQSRL